MATARAWLEASGSAAGAGRILYCHENTVRYRMRRIEEVFVGQVGQVGEAGVVVGVVVAAVDRFPRCERQFRLLALETALRAGLGHALAGAQVVQVRLEFGDHGEGSHSRRLVRISPASAMLRANRSNFVVVSITCRSVTAAAAEVTAVSALSSPARFLRVVPENPRSMKIRSVGTPSASSCSVWISTSCSSVEQRRYPTRKGSITGQSFHMRGPHRNSSRNTSTEQRDLGRNPAAMVFRWRIGLRNTYLVHIDEVSGIVENRWNLPCSCWLAGGSQRQ